MKTLNDAMTCGGLDSWNNFMGDRSHDNWYMIGGRSRDSDILEESNFATMLDMLGGESDDVFIYHVGHWACGWIEEILINPDNQDMVKIAQDIEKQLDDYPILNEDDYSERESQDQIETWENASRADFRDMLEARFDVELSDDDIDRLFYDVSDTIGEYWENDGCGSYINLERIAESVTIYDMARHIPEALNIVHAEALWYQACDKVLV